jgi:very-short-patch-repair endonuclease
MKFQLSASHKQLIAERAWAMRQVLTPSESTLWQAICKEQLGVTFKWQQPVGKYIADFVAPSARLIVEWYGSQCTPR